MKENDPPNTFREALNPHFGYYYTIKETLYRCRTRFQDLEIVSTPELGRVLLLDRITQVAEKGEFQYHEPMVHPALACHPAPSRVMVIGGGDGCTLREVLKYHTVDAIDFVDLDGEVVDCARKYLSDLNENAFDAPRVHLHITDGREFVKETASTYDIIIMDMTDPFGPSRYLYTREFFRHVKDAFKDEHGIFVMHSESPISRPDAFACIQKTLCSVFHHVQPLYTYIQMYGVLWSVSLASDSTAIRSVNARQIDSRMVERGVTGLKAVNGATVEAMRVAYPYIDEIRQNRGRIITDAAPDFPDNFPVES